MKGVENICLGGASYSGEGFEFAEARERAILEQMPMVKSLARSIQTKLPRHIEMDDLVSAGVCGLIEAASRFDATLGVTFGSFAYNRIRGAIFDKLRADDAAPRGVREKGKLIEGAVSKLSAIFGRMPTEAEVASFLQIPVKEYRSLVQSLWMFNIRSAHEETPSGDLLIDLIPDRSPSQQSRLERNELVNLMRQAIESLPERQKTVISLYYYREMTMSQIGREIGVDESCVSKTHAKGLLNLKASMRDASKAAGHGIKKAAHQPGAQTPKSVRASHGAQYDIAAFRKRA